MFPLLSTRLIARNSYFSTSSFLHLAHNLCGKICPRERFWLIMLEIWPERFQIVAILLCLHQPKGMSGPDVSTRVFAWILLLLPQWLYFFNFALTFFHRDINAENVIMKSLNKHQLHIYKPLQSLQFFTVYIRSEDILWEGNGCAMEEVVCSFDKWFSINCIGMPCIDKEILTYWHTRSNSAKSNISLPLHNFGSSQIALLISQNTLSLANKQYYLTGGRWMAGSRVITAVWWLTDPGPVC